MSARRLIPAHAGKTASEVVVSITRLAHPRSRGENDGNGSVRALSAGSSPLTRGKHGIMGPATINARLIPAHAGKTRPQNDAGIQGAAHPRSRGENWDSPPQ